MISIGQVSTWQVSPTLNPTTKGKYSHQLRLFTVLI